MDCGHSARGTTLPSVHFIPTTGEKKAKHNFSFPNLCETVILNTRLLNIVFPLVEYESGKNGKIIELNSCQKLKM